MQGFVISKPWLSVQGFRGSGFSFGISCDRHETPGPQHSRASTSASSRMPGAESTKASHRKATEERRKQRSEKKVTAHPKKQNLTSQHPEAPRSPTTKALTLRRSSFTYIGPVSSYPQVPRVLQNSAFEPGFGVSNSTVSLMLRVLLQSSGDQCTYF